GLHRQRRSQGSRAMKRPLAPPVTFGIGLVFARPKVIAPLRSCHKQGGRPSGEEDTMPKQETTKRLSTGIAGLDEVLHGGLLPHRSYLVRGTAGTGKTTLGVHFLTAGSPQPLSPEGRGVGVRAANGEKSLLITLGTPEA